MEIDNNLGQILAKAMQEALDKDMAKQFTANLEASSTDGITREKVLESMNKIQKLLEDLPEPEFDFFTFNHDTYEYFLHKKLIEPHEENPKHGWAFKTLAGLPFEVVLDRGVYKKGMLVCWKKQPTLYGRVTPPKLVKIIQLKEE